MVVNEEKMLQQGRYLIEPAYKEEGYTLALYEGGKKRYLLSKYYPKKEALRMLGEEFGNRQTIWVLIGFGLAYITEELLNRVGEDVSIIVTELSSELLEMQLDVASHIKNQMKDNVKFFVGEDSNQLEKILKDTISRTEVNNVKIITLENYLTYKSDFCKFVLGTVEKHLSNLVINNNTSLELRRIGIQNTLANRYAMQQSYDLSQHQGRYKGIPGLIVSAGPSLEKNIHLIKDFKGIIFCMGRTLTAIMNQGVKPDFIVSLDAYDEVYETFGNHKEHDIPLITLVEGNHKVVETSYGPQYFLHNSGTVSGILGLKVNPTLALQGTVASLCLSTAHYMGCEPIVFIGQDLAYTDDKRHSTLSSDDLIGLGGNCVEDYVRKQDFRYIKGYFGEQVRSDEVMISFLGWIKSFIEQEGGLYINATEGGAFIEGAKHITFKECIKQYCTKEKPVIEHYLLKANEDQDIDENIKDAILRLEQIKNLAKQLKSLYSQLIEEYTIYKGKRSEKIYELITAIEKADQEILEIDKNHSMINILLSDIELIIALNNDNKEPLDELADEHLIRNLRLNNEFYNNLTVGIKQLINIIEGEVNS